MARWSTVVPTWTPTATADTTNLVDNTHHTIQGGSSTQRGELREVYLGGQAGASSPTFMVLGRTSQVGTGTLGAARNAALDPATAALAAPPLPYITAATNKPQRSSTLGMLLNLSFNAFGGVIRWVNGPDEIISYLGNAASLGELSLNAFTGGTPGLLGSGIIFETL
jgi:hypothetical protein